MKTKKNLFVLMLFFAMSFTQLHAEESGIQFSEGTWTEIQAKAKAENKFIFVDAYTVWCGPCKWMDKNVFTQAEVGEFFNENFVSYRLDMEKGEGPEFAREHGVRAYPTFLFFSPEGTLVHRAVGGRAPEDFVKVGAAATKPESQSETLKKRFVDGERDQAFLYDYSMMLISGYEDASEAVSAYLGTLDKESKMSEKTWELIQAGGKDPESKAFALVLDNRKEFNKAHGEEAVDAFLLGSYETMMMNALRAGDEDKLNAAKKAVEQNIKGEAAKKFCAQADFNLNARDPQKAFPYAITYFDNFEHDSQSYNSIAWFYFQNSEDKKHLTKALEWAKKSVKLDENFANTDTQAHIHYALGQNKEAISLAKRSIELGKAAGEDVSTTEELLEMATEE
ncbi:MAG: thioredoxin family protein [Bacteroidota bacterium]